MSPVRRTVRPHERRFLVHELTPLGAYRRLVEMSSERFLFESVTGGEQLSRYSLLGSAPSALLTVYEDRAELRTDSGVTKLDGPPREAVERQLSLVQGPAVEGLPFAGGWVGWFGYDWVRLLERLPGPRDPETGPLAVLARFDAVVVFDHARQEVILVSNEIEGEVDRASALERLDELEAAVSGGGGRGAVPWGGVPAASLPADVSLPSTEFRRGVETIQEHIRAGDAFQVVLARRWTADVGVEPIPLYAALRAINPSPYMVLLELPGPALVGASPEMLVRKTGRRLQTRPIAGTRPRGVDEAADRRAAADLLADPKERAEHVMLVDLGRNDLGRVARPGTVSVESFFEVERYSHVMHLVSSVTGEAAESDSAIADALGALSACFPAGTVSGAPKVKAMEILAGLEPVARGPYAGAVGYVSFAGDLDTCITIRTLTVEDGRVSVTAGAGVVADSVPAMEEAETENKAAALFAAVEAARR